MSNFAIYLFQRCGEYNTQRTKKGGVYVNKYAKKIITSVCACALVLGGSLTAMASADNIGQVFYGWMPKNQGDIEFNDSIVAKTTNRNYFNVEVTTIDKYDRARAWTESEWGSNFSDPYNNVYLGMNTITYDSKPSIGTNVVLNADNPYKVDSEVWIHGYWTPN